MKRKTGLSRPTNITESDFYSYRQAGIDCLEISPEENQYDSMDIHAIKALADKYGIALRSFHLRFSPFTQYDISSTDENMRRFAIDYHKKFIKMCADVGIGIFVIHPSGEPIAEEDRPQRLLLSKKSLCELAEYAAGFDSVIAVEDLPRSCLANKSAELLALIADDSRLKICFDTNHLLHENICDFIRSTAPHIIATHFSDFDFINERHWLPGEGDIDWKELMDTLDAVGYTYPVLYELSFKAANVARSIRRPRDLTPADISRNHAELESRSSLTVCGERYAKLGMWGLEE